MKKFITPEVELRELTPSQSIMDDITVSANAGFGGSEQIVQDPGKDDEATW